MVRLLRARGVLLLLAGVVAIGLTTAAQAVEPKLLPGNAEIVFSVNIKQILDSEVVKAQKKVIDQFKALLLDKIPGDDQAQKYLEKLGFDPVKDLSSLTITHNGTKDPEALCMVIEGSFNTAKFEATAAEAAKENGDHLKISKIGNIKVYDVCLPDDKHIFVSVLSAQHVVITQQQDLLNEVIGRGAGTGKGKGGLKKEVRDLLKTTSDKQSLNFILTGTALARLAEGNRKIPNADKVGEYLKQIEGVSGAITVNKDIDFQLGIGSKDEATAKKFVAAGNFGLIALNLMVNQEVQKNQELLPLADVMKTMQVKTVGNNTVLTGRVSFDNLDKLIKSFNKLNQP